MILGAPMRSIYEMLMPKEYIEMVENRQFERGEGILLLQGSDLHFVKIPTVRDMEKNAGNLCQGIVVISLKAGKGGGEAASP